MIIVVTTDGPSPPRVTFPIPGDYPGVVEVRDTAAAIAHLDTLTPAPGVWTWVGHNRHQYIRIWHWFMCLGPPGWMSDTQIASRGSTDEVHRRRVEQSLAKVRNRGKRGQPGSAKKLVDQIASGVNPFKF